MTTTTAVRAPRRSAIRMPISARTRKALLVLHICAAGAWLGMDLVLGLLMVAVYTADSTGAAAALIGIGAFATWPLATAGLLTLGTGVLLGLGTKYGLARYWWVAVKLVINIVLVTLVLILLGPSASDLSGQARAVLDGSGTMPVLGNLFMPPIVSTTAVLIAMTLSTFKPWGRIRKG